MNELDDKFPHVSFGKDAKAIMKKFIIVLMVMLGAATMTVPDAEAKRLGGGGSSGQQSQSVARQAPGQPSQAARPATPPATAPQGVPPKPASPWRGMIGGALLGLGLGAVLSHFGLGGAMASMISTLLMVALLAFAGMFIYRLFKRKSEANNAPAYAGGVANYAGRGTSESGPVAPPQQQSAALEVEPITTGTHAQPWGVPLNFDVPGFLRSAKTYYIRLQAAWDKGDMSDIREFTTTEMFAELKMELQERGAASNYTDVVTLDAELMGIEIVSDQYLASVKFNGLIKEDRQAPAVPFSEIWNLSKPLSASGGWVLAGIQQLA